MCADPCARLQNNSSRADPRNLLGFSEHTFQKSHTDPSPSHLGSRVLGNNGVSIALSCHFEDSTPESIESSTASWVGKERHDFLGNARFERAAFGSGGRSRVPSCGFRLFSGLHASFPPRKRVEKALAVENNRRNHRQSVSCWNKFSGRS